MISSDDVVDRLLSDPSAWAFSPTDEEIRRVRDAYVAYRMSCGAAPDFDGLRICIVGGFGGDVQAFLAFWDRTLLNDAPPREDVSAVMRAQIEDVWRRGKIAAVLSSLELEPLTEWERMTMSACLKVPDQLCRVGEELAEADRDGFSFISFEVDEASAIVTWHLRRIRPLQER
jgi:hypothetical protein